jgi:hypothetical protein
VLLASSETDSEPKQISFAASAGISSLSDSTAAAIAVSSNDISESDSTATTIVVPSNHISESDSTVVHTSTNIKSDSAAPAPLTLIDTSVSIHEPESLPQAGPTQSDESSVTPPTPLLASSPSFPASSLHSASSVLPNTAPDWQTRLPSLTAEFAPTSAPGDRDSSDETKGLQTTMVAGIAAGLVAVIIAVAVFLWVWMRRRESSNSTEDLPIEMPTDPSELEFEPAEEYISEDNPLIGLALTEQNIILSDGFVE